MASFGGPADALATGDGEVPGDGVLLADEDGLAFGLEPASGLAATACPVPPEVVGVGDAFVAVTSMRYRRAARCLRRTASGSGSA